MGPISTACLAAAILASSTPARADEWTKTDTVLELAVVASLGLDYLQTKQIMEDGREQNAILDRCASKYVDDIHCNGLMPPEMYFVGIALVHAAIARIAPRPWRTLIQGVTLGVQAKSVVQNYRLGYGFAF